MNKKLEDINGYEIIDFLNKITSEDNDYLEDISIVGESFVFHSQEIDKKTEEYRLNFSADFNNWGHHQKIEGNYIKISKNKIRFYLEEPFDGDGTDDILEDAVSNWIENHEFESVLHTEEKFNKILENIYRDVSELSITDKNKIQSIIDNLIKAKTYMK